MVCKKKLSHCDDTEYNEYITFPIENIVSIILTPIVMTDNRDKQ